MPKSYEERSVKWRRYEPFFMGTSPIVEGECLPGAKEQSGPFKPYMKSFGVRITGYDEIIITNYLEDESGLYWKYKTVVSRGLLEKADAFEMGA